jgi:hypothetical protein
MSLPKPPDRSGMHRPPAPAAVDAGYVRARDLPKLVALWPREIATTSLADHARLLAKLRRALRAERQRGLGGHWTYDLARHAQLLRAYRAETAAYLRAAMAPSPRRMPD